MKAVPLDLNKCNAFVSELHRHHAPVHRDKWRVGCVDDDGKLHGVIQVARPVSRYLDDGKTVEVVRCCSDGTRNVCSFLYSRAARIAKEMGYEKIITYILDSESGTSLKASGWKVEQKSAGGVHGVALADHAISIKNNLYLARLKRNIRQRRSKDGLSFYEVVK